MLHIANCYYYGDIDTRDYIKAFELYSYLSDKLDDPIILYNLATLYRDGNGAKQDYKEAFKIFSELAKNDYPKAENDLGNLYLSKAIL